MRTEKGDCIKAVARKPAGLTHIAPIIDEVFTDLVLRKTLADTGRAHHAASIVTGYRRHESTLNEKKSGAPTNTPWIHTESL